MTPEQIAEATKLLASLRHLMNTQQHATRAYCWITGPNPYQTSVDAKLEMDFSIAKKILASYIADRKAQLKALGVALPEELT